MNKSLFFILLSGLIICASCESRWLIKDKSGTLGKTTGPVANTFSLNQTHITAAREGRLGLTEPATNKNKESVIPVQWEISESGAKSVAVMLVPAGDPGRRNFTWSENKTKFVATMQAVQDPESGQIIMSDDGKPVLHYNYKTVYEKDAIDTLPANKYIVTANDTFMANPSIYAVPRSNYIHPVYGPAGEILTRDWSRDHPHHRGIYWAWPEVKFGSKLGDLHALQIVFARPTGRIKLQNGPVFAQIEAENLWMWRDSVPIVSEVAVIRAYRSTDQGRVIDLAFRFIALKDSITLARRETKLYGGLNIRMQTPKLQEISVHSDSANTVPRRVWSDLSGLFAGAETNSGMMVLQNQQNPDYPGDWVQYPELSWCQPTFPASGTRYSLVRGKPLVLRYRLLVHTGTKLDNNLSSMMWDTFNSEVTPVLTFSLSESGSVK